MKLLYCLVSFGLIGIVFGGGVSECGSIESNFLELFDVSESKVRRFLDLLECELIFKSSRNLKIFK